jgi:ubiquinone/menaquinone biosynthesis C-methylase UbiE
MDLTQEQYNNIAEHYEIFYSGFDMNAFAKDFINQHESFLNALPKNAKLCDCSCGNGIQAIALKKAGFDVVATDISDEMIHLTQKNAKENNVDFPIKRMSWKELPGNYRNEFDAVFCWGNSISHSLSEQEMVENLTAIASTLKINGKLFIETRNWDKLVTTKQRYYNYEIKEFKGKKYIPFYIMNIGNFDEVCNLEMMFIEIKNDLTTDCTGFRLDFMPFRHSDFIDRLETVGLKILKNTFNKHDDFYYMVVEKPN